MAVDTAIRQIPREKLFAILKSEELVRLFESFLSALRVSIPTDIADVQGGLDAHIADTSDAHQAGAIGFTPAGGLSSNNVQAALAELDAEKQAVLVGLTAFGLTLIQAAGAASARTTLGLGTIATQNAASVAITGGSVLLANGMLGYAPGNGGTVTQLTSKSTGVTLNTPSGEVTLDGGALAAGTPVTFVLTNSVIAAGDRLVLNHISGGTFGAYHLDAQCAAGSATIAVRNLTSGSLAEAIIVGFTLVKSANT